LIPFNQGKILLAATHENEQDWDLEKTVSAFQQLTSGSAPFLKEAEQLFKQPMHYPVDTGAYTSELAPFFGRLPELPHLVVA
ncbi:NAD(P)/FAD-dependent oxidoreductase, partial [Enterococcus faecalis]